MSDTYTFLQVAGLFGFFGLVSCPVRGGRLDAQTNTRLERLAPHLFWWGVFALSSDTQLILIVGAGVVNMGGGFNDKMAAPHGELPFLYLTAQTGCRD